MFHKFQIRNDGITTKVFMDGKEIEGVRAVSFEHSAVGLPNFRLDLLADELTLDTTVLPELPEPYRSFYSESKTEEPLSDGSAE
jgi:hypothetical protein